MKTIVYITFFLMLAMWKPESVGNGQTTVPALDMLIPDPPPDSIDKELELKRLMKENKVLDSILIKEATKPPETKVVVKTRTVVKEAEAVVYLRHQDGTLERRVIEPGNAPIIDLVEVRDTVYVNEENEKKGWLRRIF